MLLKGWVADQSFCLMVIVCRESYVQEFKSIFQVILSYVVHWIFSAQKIQVAQAVNKKDK